MKNIEIVIASNNEEKNKEIIDIFKYHNITATAYYNKINKAVFPKENIDYLENSKAKASFIYSKIKGNILGDDSGIVIEKFPDLFGVKTNRSFPQGLNAQEKNEYLLKLLQDVDMPERKATLYSYITLILESGKTIKVKGSCEGYIAKNSITENGYGFDSIFIEKESRKLFSQMKDEERYSYSHRGKAIKELCEELKELGY